MRISREQAGVEKIFVIIDILFLFTFWNFFDGNIQHMICSLHLIFFFCLDLYTSLLGAERLESSSESSSPRLFPFLFLKMRELFSIKCFKISGITYLSSTTQWTDLARSNSLVLWPESPAPPILSGSRILANVSISLSTIT